MMAIAVKPGAQTPTDQLRTLLAQSEDRLVKLSGREAAAEFFFGLDRLAELWPAVQESGVDVRGEWTRWESLQSQLDTRGTKVLAAWGGSQALGNARTAVTPDTSHWWWWLDELEAQKRRSRLLKMAGTVAVVIAVVAAGLLLVNRLFPVDVRLREAYTLRTDAEAAIITGDYEQAINSMKQAVTVLPEDPSMQIMYGVLADLSGDTVTAEQGMGYGPRTSRRKRWRVSRSARNGLWPDEPIRQVNRGRDGGYCARSKLRQGLFVPGRSVRRTEQNHRGARRLYKGQ